MNTIKFQSDQSGFYAELIREVNLYFRLMNMQKTANKRYFIKAGIIITGFIGSCVFIYRSQTTGQLFLGYSMFGFFTVMMFLNIIHDAAHNAIFKKKKWNALAFSIFNLLGVSPHIWKARHVESHHNFANIPGHDVDIRQFPLVRISAVERHRSIHRFQHLYMPPLYLLYTLFWLTYRDFRDLNLLFNEKKLSYRDRLKKLAGTILPKAFYFLYALVVPIAVLSFSWYHIALAFICAHLVSSTIAAIALLSAHVGENAQFAQPDENGLMNHSWAEHQFITTTDFGRNNWVVTQLFGGFNLHVCHHLFPHICHIHYSKLTAIINRKAAEHKLGYESNSVLGALYSHWKLLKKNGLEEDEMLFAH